MNWLSLTKQRELRGDTWSNSKGGRRGISALQQCSALLPTMPPWSCPMNLVQLFSQTLFELNFTFVTKTFLTEPRYLEYHEIHETTTILLPKTIQESFCPRLKTENKKSRKHRKMIPGWIMCIIFYHSALYSIILQFQIIYSVYNTCYGGYFNRLNVSK